VRVERAAAVKQIGADHVEHWGYAVPTHNRNRARATYPHRSTSPVHPQNDKIHAAHNLNIMSNPQNVGSYSVAHGLLGNWRGPQKFVEIKAKSSDEYKRLEFVTGTP
jgi:hypothetical protein